MRNFLKRKRYQRIVAITITDAIVVAGVIIALGIYAIILTKEKTIDVPVKYTEQKTKRPNKPVKQAKAMVDKKGAAMHEDHNAYELLTPRMKENVRLKVLRDFAKHPEKYRIKDGTIHLR